MDLQYQVAIATNKEDTNLFTYKALPVLTVYNMEPKRKCTVCEIEGVLFQDRFPTGLSSEEQKKWLDEKPWYCAEHINYGN